EVPSMGTDILVLRRDPAHGDGGPLGHAGLAPEQKDAKPVSSCSQEKRGEIGSIQIELERSPIFDQAQDVEADAVVQKRELSTDGSIALISCQQIGRMRVDVCEARRLLRYPAVYGRNPVCRRSAADCNTGDVAPGDAAL